MKKQAVVYGSMLVLGGTLLSNCASTNEKSGLGGLWETIEKEEKLQTKQEEKKQKQRKGLPGLWNGVNNNGYEKESAVKNEETPSVDSVVKKESKLVKSVVNNKNNANMYGKFLNAMEDLKKQYLITYKNSEKDPNKLKEFMKFNDYQNQIIDVLKKMDNAWQQAHEKNLISKPELEKLNNLEIKFYDLIIEKKNKRIKIFHENGESYKR